MNSGFVIRPAKPEEATLLTCLAMRSKAHWGYDAAFMAACRTELTVTQEQIAEAATFVYEEQGRALATYGLDIDGSMADIAFFYVDPSALRRGIGSEMWRHLLDECRRQGIAKITIVSDPNAERFYLSLGAQPVGTVASESIPGRRLPTLEYALEVR